jgi:hypothetical protein
VSTLLRPEASPIYLIKVSSGTQASSKPMRTKTGGIRLSISFVFDKDILEAFIPPALSVKYKAIIKKQRL